MKSKIKLCCFILCILDLVLAADEGQRCNLANGAEGKCVVLMSCPKAIEDLKNQRRPQICSFAGTTPIVCCAATASTTARPATTTKRTSTTTVAANVLVNNPDDESSEDQCEALAPSLTSKPIGSKSWDKCLEYQEQLVYPCVKGVQLTGEKTRVNRCGHNADDLIIGGINAARAEFPHMVLLNFGEPEENQWLCAGSIISERFILTAGHCTSYRRVNVSYAALSAYKRTSIDSNKIYKIQEIIKHPQFSPPSKYHDIALLKTETPMKLDQFTVPACLPVPVANSGKDEKALASGWGAVEYRGSLADILQKVTLSKFATEECAAKFPPERLMKQGFDVNTQICYGDKTMSKDTCQGDSGGPLQIKNKLINCMYTVIGVTSFGKACGFIGDPGIYTKVQYYVPWIESIVWP